ncbi:MAG: DMT family transporter [Verrucomicrobia bacterium]|nr:DMT family transporter [Cytophagales bacterium]
MKYWFILLAIICGAIFPIQAGLNNKLTKITSNPIITTFFSVMIGFLSIFFYVIITKQKFPTFIKITESPWYVWLAGTLGTIYVGSIIFLVPKLGIAFTFSLVVTGQIAVSVLLDHFGIFGVREPITLGKIVGSLLIILGVIAVRYG